MVKPLRPVVSSFWQLEAPSQLVGLDATDQFAGHHVRQTSLHWGHVKDRVFRFQYKIFMIYEPVSLAQLEQYQWTYWTERSTKLITDLILFVLPMVHM
ncbi:hypothetical protein C0J52_18796 [Blattella germanica]|nr:hypothetical protein C0J52_18796 [Blattella germanica]